MRGLKAGLMVSVSDRALIKLAPILAFLAQLGTRPQRSARSLRAPAELVATA